MTRFDLAEFFKWKKGKFGSAFYYFHTLESTNLLAYQMATQNSEEGTVVLAEQQSGGKGRLGRSWFSPEGLNLYFTIITHPRRAYFHYLPFVTAMATIRTLENLGLHPDLKWPNDVLVNAKKICGILIQTSMEEDRLKLAVIGCGINVNVQAFPAEIAKTATSIARETRQEKSREMILASFLFEFESLYEKIPVMDWTGFCSELEKRSTYLRGCRVQVDQGDTLVEGVTSGLDSYGGLIVDTPEGQKTFYAGEIQSCRKK